MFITCVMAPTNTQMGIVELSELLNKSNIRILYLFFDNDYWGKRFKQNLLDKLRKDILIVDVDITKTGKKDINELSEDEFWDCIIESENKF